jgi:hypothetical protein
MLRFLGELFGWIGTACILVVFVAGEVYLVRMLNAGDIINLCLAFLFGIIDCGVLGSGLMLAAK